MCLLCLKPRQNLLAAAGKIGEASQEVMDEIGESVEDMDKAFQVSSKISRKSFLSAVDCSLLREWFLYLNFFAIIFTLLKCYIL